MNLFLLLIMLLTGLGALLLLFNYCSLTSCELSLSYFKMTDGILAPLTAGSLALSFILAITLSLPAPAFKKWLQYIASWYVPVAFFMTASIPVTGGGLLMPSRSQMALQMMAGLFVITVLYTLYHRFCLRTET